MSEVLVDNITSRSGGAVGAPSGIVVTGVITATSFVGNASGLSGIDATALKDSGGNVKVQGNTSGIVVTGVSTFTDNVSVGGVVTYEDVTNIDSVGIITARNGIKVSAGQSISAVSGIVTYYGDGSQLTGVESGVVNFVASGTIPNGATVVVKTDGTVGVVTATISPAGFGSPVTFDSDDVSKVGSVYDSTSGKVVVIYEDSGNSNAITAIVGTVSGTSISFGTPVQAHTSAYFAVVASGGPNKVVIAFRDNGNSNYGAAVVGTVSGTSISFGTKVTINSVVSQYQSITSASSGKVVICYNRSGSTPNGTAVVGTVSGTSISFGSEVAIGSNSTTSYSATYDSTNDKVVISYRDNTNSEARSIVGTISGTSISFGSPTAFESSNMASQLASVFDSTNGKVVIVYQDYGNSNYGTAVVGTVSGTSISFGTPVVFNSASTDTAGATFDTTNGKVIIAFKDASNSNYGTAIVGTVSGTSISFGSKSAFNSATTAYINQSIAYDSTNEKVVIGYRINPGSARGEAVVFTPVSQSTTNLTAENYIGIAAEAISNGATGKINVFSGTNTGQTGLTTAQKYFVQPNGTLSTSAGSPSVVAGTAISDTKIVVR